MMLPGEQHLLDERAAVLTTIESLTDDEFEAAPTLCEGWAPRDVLAHLVGIDDALGEYLKAYGNIGRANAAIVERMRKLSREELTERARKWAGSAPVSTRLSAFFLLGDVAVHHQDILRGLGRTRSIPSASRDAILREGFVLGGRKLLSHRVVPDDGGRAMGRGTVVRGSSEALGLWLTGRDVTGELSFES